MRTALLVVALFLGLCTFAGGLVPTETQGIGCPGYGPPDGNVGITDRYCYSFRAVAGEKVGATCSASGVGPGGSPYPMDCMVLIGPRDGSEFAVESPDGAAATVAYTIPQTDDYLVESVYFGRHTFFANEGFSLSQLSLPTCVSDQNSLCLGGWRFRVTADWEAPDGTSGHGAAVGLTGDSGYFTFFDAANVEVVAKIHEACGYDQKWWFFAGGLTDVQVTLTVTDTATNASHEYVNPLGIAFRPIQDTAAFPCP